MPANPRIPDVANDRARTAIDTALTRQFNDGERVVDVTPETRHALVHTFRDVLNEAGEVYESFDYSDVAALLESV